MALFWQKVLNHKNTAENQIFIKNTEFNSTTLKSQFCILPQSTCHCQILGKKCTCIQTLLGSWLTTMQRKINLQCGTLTPYWKYQLLHKPSKLIAVKSGELKMVSWVLIIFDKLKRNKKFPRCKPFVPVRVHQLHLIYMTQMTNLSMQGNLTLPQEKKNHNWIFF